MDHFPSIVQAHLSPFGQALFEGGFVGEPLFSKGTYQVEVRDKKASYFPFLQIQDDGVLSDSFCTCKISEKGGGCPHLSAAYLRIFNGTLEPLHIRFRKSLWNRVFQMSSKRHGYSTDCLKKEGTITSCESKTKKKAVLLTDKERRSESSV